MSHCSTAASLTAHLLTAPPCALQCVAGLLQAGHCGAPLTCPHTAGLTAASYGRAASTASCAASCHRCRSCWCLAERDPPRPRPPKPPMPGLTGLEMEKRAGWGISVGRGGLRGPTEASSAPASCPLFAQLIKSVGQGIVVWVSR